MLDFILKNSITIILIFYVGGNLFYWVYDQYFYKNVRDDWFKTLMFYKIAMKSHSRHPEFVGKSIRLSEDTHMIVREDDGSYTRAEKIN
jgi:hypothetical protein